MPSWKPPAPPQPAKQPSLPSLPSRPSLPSHPQRLLVPTFWRSDWSWSVLALFETSVVADEVAVCDAVLGPELTLPPAIETGTLALTAFCWLAATPRAPCVVVALWSPAWNPPEPPESATAAGAAARATSPTATLSSLAFISFSLSRWVTDSRVVAERRAHVGRRRRSARVPGETCEEPRLPEGRSRKQSRQERESKGQRRGGERADDEWNLQPLAAALDGRGQARSRPRRHWRGALRRRPRRCLLRRPRMRRPAHLYVARRLRRARDDHGAHEAVSAAGEELDRARGPLESSRMGPLGSRRTGAARVSRARLR